MRRALVGILGLVVAGCLDPDEPSTHSFYRQPAPTAAMPPMPAASTEAAARVDTLGRRIVAANPGLGTRPQFHTIGSPQTEVFHRGASDVFVTEGLVSKCDEATLAAVLCLELGKMVRAREATAPSEVRNRDRLPPWDIRLGTEDQMNGTPDKTGIEEYVQFDKERKARRAAPKLPDSQALARDYLARAGISPDAITAACPVLQAAASESALEKQMTSPPPEPVGSTGY